MDDEKEFDPLSQFEPQIEKFILKLVERIDYDIYKSFLPDMAEDPEAKEEQMDDLKQIVKDFLYKFMTY